MTPKDLDPSELEANEGEALPPREVMSLISTSPTASLLPTDGAPTPDHGTDTAGSAPSSADDASHLTGVDADASAHSGDATPVAEDRSETFTSSDSASAT